MNQKYYAIAGIFAVLLQMSQLSVAEKQPDWVEGGSRLFSDELYMTATGSASNAELAKNRALANLSKIFESHIRATTFSKSSTQVVSKNGNKQISGNQSVSQQVQLRTDKIINGVRIAETWKDDQIQVWHSLAVLDRTQASNNIQQEIQRLDFATQVALDQSQLHSDKLLSMSALHKSVLYQSERAALHKMLKVIDIQGRGYPSRWALAELKGRLELKLISLGIAAAVDDDPVGKLDEALKSAMGNAGFPAVDTQSSYTLVASLYVQDLGFRQGWYWLRAKLSLKVVSSDGKIRGRKQWFLKVSALKRIDTESRLMTQVDKTLNAELKNAVLQIATGVE